MWPFGRRKDLSNQLLGHLVTEWFGAEAVASPTLNPVDASRMTKALSALSPIEMEVRSQLILASKEQPKDWLPHRELVLGFIYGRAQMWAQVTGEPSDWAAVFISMHIARRLLEDKWVEREVVQLFDACIAEMRPTFTAGQREGCELALGADAYPRSITLAKQLHNL